MFAVIKITTAFINTKINHKMKKTLRLLGLFVLLLSMGQTVSAQDVTALWDFANGNPESLKSVTTIEGVVRNLPSTADGVELIVDATKGKVRNNNNSYQVNVGTVLKVPVKSMRDVVTVAGYSGYSHYAIGGVEATELVTEHKATKAEADAGFVEITSTDNNNYICSIQVVHVSPIQSKSIYKTDFSEWKPAAASQSETVYSWKTKYSGEDLNIAIYNTEIKNVTDSKFNAIGLPHMALMASKASDPYVTTSPLANISKVRFIHGATGSNRGWKLEAKGDGDADWVVLSSDVANPASGAEVVRDVNRTNCQLRFTNLNGSQNAYMFELEVFANVDLSATPILGTFKLNGKEYVAGEIFEDVDDTKATATLYISRNETPVSANNPLTDITADNGVLGELVYDVNDNVTVVTIPVSFGSMTKNYVLTVEQLPMIDVHYINSDGTTIGTQQVEKYSKITKFAYGENDVTVVDGKKFRGWFATSSGGRKVSVEDAVEKEMNIYAVVTTIETSESKASHFFDLRDQYFYAEDHEAFVPTGGSWHDKTHGWAFGKDNTIDILVSGNADIMLGTCLYSDDVQINVGSQTVSAKATSDGQLQTVRYEGAPGKLTIKFNGTTYLHTIAIVNEASLANGYYVVEKGNANDFITAVNIANATAGTSGYKIFLPDGVYDLGERVLTTVSGNNISIIGQSMDGTIIKNAPQVKNEGIGTTATILNTGSNLYMQDITLQNALDYYGSGAAGRAVCLQDKGAKTICKNVKMLSYQDTYYSNSNSQFYWETSEIHGTVDYLCGGGDVYYNKCLLVNESRSANGKSGSCTIAAPQTDPSNRWGYVLNGCTIETRSASFNFGRAWGGEPRLAYINTIINQPDVIDNDGTKAKRFTLAGMNVPAKSFVEYNSMSPDGTVVSPASNVCKFYKDKTVNEMETILSAEQAEAYSLDNVFKTWKPAEVAAQKEVGAVKVGDGMISWDAVDGVTTYAVFNNNEFVGMTESTVYNVSVGEADKYSVRAANARGGFGPVSGSTSGIGSAVADKSDVVETVFYNLQGVRVSGTYKGVVVKVDTMKDGRTIAEKVVR